MLFRKKRKRFQATNIIMYGFLISALLGSVLLMQPFCLKPGVKIDYIDALFSSVTSVCVTGLSTINIGMTFNWLGQIVLLLLIQFGGLGIVTFTTIILLLFHKRITLYERILIQNAYNIDTLSGLVALTIKILKVTLVIEAIGAVGYAFVFIPDYGVKGIWYAVFHSVSAFCNAGIDLLGGDSFTAYRDNVMLNITSIFLIIVSGLGFPVYWDIYASFKKNKENQEKRIWRRFGVHTKIVIVMTVMLTVLAAVITLIFEFDNPDTIGNLPMWKKIQASLFQAVTLRTAGFATINQGSFKHVSCVTYIIWMFIGGSPAGTAGGVKTVTIAIMMLSMWANIKGNSSVTAFKRKVSDEQVRRAAAIISFSMLTLLVLSTALMYVQDGDFLDTMYEMTSAVATVGLSRGLTGDLNFAGKLIVILAMYLGRIGPITLALAFNSNSKKSNIEYAEGKITIG